MYREYYYAAKNEHTNDYRGSNVAEPDLHCGLVVQEPGKRPTFADLLVSLETLLEA